MNERVFEQFKSYIDTNFTLQTYYEAYVCDLVENSIADIMKDKPNIKSVFIDYQKTKDGMTEIVFSKTIRVKLKQHTSSSYSTELIGKRCADILLKQHSCLSKLYIGINQFTGVDQATIDLQFVFKGNHNGNNFETITNFLDETNSRNPQVNAMKIVDFIEDSVTQYAERIDEGNYSTIVSKNWIEKKIDDSTYVIRIRSEERIVTEEDQRDKEYFKQLLKEVVDNLTVRHPEVLDIAVELHPHNIEIHYGKNESKFKTKSTKWNNNTKLPNMGSKY